MKKSATIVQNGLYFFDENENDQRLIQRQMSRKS